MAIIETVGLSKSYTNEHVATPALHDVSLTINSGEFVAIMGPSGSGKSTLLHILGFLDQPSRGEYRFDGQSIESYSERALAQVRNKKMGFIFQAFNLLPRTTVLRNVMLPLQYSTIPTREHHRLAAAALAQVELSHRLEHLPNQLSGGEKQRVAIARALVVDPLVIFADEPTGNLDSKTGKIVMETIDQLHSQGRTIVVITHETPTARYAQRIIELKDGQVVADEQVRTNTHAHYQK